MRYQIPSILILAAVVLLMLWYMCSKPKHDYKDIQISALTDVAKSYRNKWNQEVTEKRVFMGSYKDLAAVHASDSSELGRLNKMVDKLTISAIALSTATSGTLSGRPSVFNPPGASTGSATGRPVTRDPEHWNNETVEHASTSSATNCPGYTDTLTDKWSTISYTVTPEKGEVKYLIINDFDIKQVWRKEGKWPFRKDVPYLTVVNQNTNTVNHGIMSFAAAPKDNRPRNGILGVVILCIGVLIGKSI